jgi:ribonuclease HI
MYFNGSFTLNRAGGGVVLISPKGDRLLYVIRLHFCATNNVAEYGALINGLCIAVELGVQRLYICGNSELVVN